MNNAYEVLEERISEWGISNKEIIAVYIVGSRAREDKPFDEFSDLDVVVFSTNPDYYLQNDQWLLNIGKVWTSFMFRTAKGDPEKLVLFDQGAEVDFLFRHISDLDHIIKNGRIPEGFQRGLGCCSIRWEMETKSSLKPLRSRVLLRYLKVLIYRLLICIASPLYMWLNKFCVMICG